MGSPLLTLEVYGLIAPDHGREIALETNDRPRESLFRDPRFPLPLHREQLSEGLWGRALRHRRLNEWVQLGVRLSDRNCFSFDDAVIV
jgi:hypothetical protein